MTFRSKVVAQFQNPHGWAGRLAGAVMAHRPSNRARNFWTIDLLNLRPHHCVLELGCGPGLALAKAAERITTGEVVGLDHSETMLAQAATRNEMAISAGRVRLTSGDGAMPPMELGPFDRIYSANVVQFWAEPGEVYRRLIDLLVPGGSIATTYQPRHARARPEDSIRKAVEIGAWMEAAGFENVRVEKLDLLPIPAICVLGERPGFAGAEASELELAQDLPAVPRGPLLV